MGCSLAMVFRISAILISMSVRPIALRGTLLNLPILLPDQVVTLLAEHAASLIAHLRWP
jgi:hypothetical protein